MRPVEKDPSPFVINALENEPQTNTLALSDKNPVRSFKTLNLATAGLLGISNSHVNHEKDNNSDSGNLTPKSNKMNNSDKSNRSRSGSFSKKAKSRVDSRNMKKLNIFIIGNMNVGKTSLLIRKNTGEFCDEKVKTRVGLDMI